MLKQDSKPSKPPDGGWGWMVVLGSFLVHVISSGIQYTQGVLLREIREHYDGTRQAMGMLAYTYLVMAYITSPMNGALVNRFPCRHVAFVGGILLCFGLVLSSVAPSFGFLFFSHSFVTAVGNGMVYMPAIVIVARYFDKRRSFALGIAACGSGIGALSLAPLTQFLINLYTWRGTALVIAGIALNCVVCAALYRPISLTVKPVVEKIELQTTQPVLKDASRREGGQGQTVTHCSKNKGGDVEHELGSTPEVTYTKGNDVTNGDVTIGADYTKSPCYSSSDDAFDASKNVPKLSRFQRFKAALNLQVFKKKAFICWVVSNCFTSMAFPTAFAFLPDLAVLAGNSPEQAAFLISLVGMTNCASRLVMGWLGDKPWVNKVIMYASAATLMGGAMAVFPFCPSYPVLAVNAAVFGIFYGQRSGQTPAVTSELFGVENLPTCLGYFEMFGAVGYLVGSSVAGLLYDKTGSYMATFVVMGCVTEVGASFVWLMTLTPEYKQLQRMRAETKRLRKQKKTP